MRRVAIVSKPQKEELKTLLPELILWMRAHGFDPILDPVSGNYTQQAPVFSRQEMPSANPELVIVLGGDGTLLAVSRVFAKYDLPILSVNLGSLGFLTEVRLSDLYSTLEGWCNNCCTVDARTMLHADLWRNGKLHSSHEALNDVVVAKGAIARMGDFTIRLFDQVAARFRADGVIVSTPTGSTGYNLSANGPILVPDTDALVVAPICPHLLTIRPMVVRGDATLTINIEGVPDQTFLTVDGQEVIQLQLGDELRCCKSQYSVKLLRLGTTGFFDVLRSKLKWGER